MSYYEIYTRNKISNDDYKEIVIHRDRFSLTAFLFPPLWLILNKNIFLIPIYIFLAYLTYFFFEVSYFLVSIFFINLFVALQTSQLREWILGFRDYSLQMVVKADNQMSAYHIYNQYYFDQNNIKEHNKANIVSDRLNNEDTPIFNIF
ncbi:MAG: hypothetical protein CML81_00805 [Rhodobiaceae bacterium]|nr:hypothetical protein [Rhodobiaceae bacterium]RPF97756.1 MAG: hypothetical protein CBD87_000800 [Rhizobiales bacterium TMED227]|tara:strand:- start:462 stop:905 length:444 start_codon:yes stop_codon:yes gene_type:complete